MNNATLKQLFIVILLLAGNILVNAQHSFSIEGFVKDSISKEPLIGAAIIVEGTNTGSICDLNGHYRIPAIKGNHIVLVAKYLGYKSEKKILNIDQQNNTTVNFNLAPVGIQGKEVIITAQAEGQISAINKQLSSSTIENVVSSKKIQEIPDANAAESLGRLPGISILRSGGEGSKIVIRGLAPKYNKIQVEGVKMASTGSGDRSTDLSMISPYMLEAIEVSKAAMPDKEADVLGGSVNFVLREAPKELKLDVLMQGGYNKLFNTYNNYKFVAGGSKRFFNNKLGVFAQIDHEKRNRHSYELKANYSNIFISNPGPNDSIDVSLSNLYLQHITRSINRNGAAMVIDYKLNSGSVKFSNFFSTIDKNIVSRFEDMRPNFFQHIYGINSNNNKLRVMTNSLSFNKSIQAFTVSGGVSYSFADNRSPDNAFFKAIEPNAFDTGVDIGEEPYKIMEKARYDLHNTNVFEISKDSSYTRENAYSININLEYNHIFSKNFSMKLKTGVKYNKLNKEYDREYKTIPVSWAGHGAYIRKKIIETYPWMKEYVNDDVSKLPYFLFVDEDYPKTEFPGGKYFIQDVPDLKLTNEILDLSEDFYFKQYPLSNKDDYSGNEEYKAYYLMSTFNIGKTITFIPGIRYENNITHYTGNRGNSSVLLWNEGYAFKDTTVTRNNAFWLPMIHLKYKPVKWFDIRLAYTKTLARPDFSQIIPKWDIQDFSVEWNNPYLVPSLSTNYDLYMSFYENKLGLLTIGGFHKSIEDLIYNTGFAVILDPQEYGLPENTAGRPVTKIINNKYPAKLWGLEAEWQTRFWYLDNFLNGIVLNINYTHTFSNVKYPKTEIKKSFIQEPPYQITENIDTFYEDRLIFQPSDIINITVGYDYKGLSSRLSFLYQDDIFAYTNFFKQLRGISDKYYRIDLSLRQKLPWKGFEALLNFSNVNSAVERDINVSTGYPIREQHYGLTIDAGIRYRIK